MEELREHVERRRLNPLSTQATKDVVKEALKEWMDDKFTEFSRWSVKGFLAMVLTGVILFAVKHDLLIK